MNSDKYQMIDGYLISEYSIFYGTI